MTALLRCDRCGVEMPVTMAHVVATFDPPARTLHFHLGCWAELQQKNREAIAEREAESRG